MELSFNGGGDAPTRLFMSLSKTSSVRNNLPLIDSLTKKVPKTFP